MRPSNGQSYLPFFTTLLLLIALLSPEAQTPHVQSSRKFRVTNRRFISHIIHQIRGGKHYVTLLTSHGPSYNNFKSGNHPLYYPCQNPARCMGVLKKLNNHLETGENIGLQLSGSIITRLIYYNQKKQESSR